MGVNMRRVAEIIHIVEEERQNFISGAINPDEETKKVLWLCGVRKQQYFSMGNHIFMTFEYEGKDFQEDMKKMSLYLDSKGLLVKTRRKDVPVEERDSTNWWAPVKNLGVILDQKPSGIESENLTVLFSANDGNMLDSDWKNDISYDDDDWSESMHM